MKAMKKDNEYERIDKHMEELKYDDSLTVSTVRVGDEQDDDEEKVETMIEIKQVNMSFIQTYTEVMSMTIDKMDFLTVQTKQEMIYEATIGRL